MSEFYFIHFLYGTQPFSNGKPCYMITLLVFALSFDVWEVIAGLCSRYASGKVSCNMTH
jgi:hypothetical protein